MPRAAPRRMETYRKRRLAAGARAQLACGTAHFQGSFSCRGRRHGAWKRTASAACCGSAIRRCGTAHFQGSFSCRGRRHGAWKRTASRRLPRRRGAQSANCGTALSRAVSHAVGGATAHGNVPQVANLRYGASRAVLIRRIAVQRISRAVSHACGAALTAGANVLMPRAALRRWKRTASCQLAVQRFPGQLLMPRAAPRRMETYRKLPTCGTALSRAVSHAAGGATAHGNVPQVANLRYSAFQGSFSCRG